MKKGLERGEILHGGGVGTPYEMGAMIDNLR